MQVSSSAGVAPVIKGVVREAAAWPEVALTPRAESI